MDAGCRNLTASWVREKSVNDGSVELCEYFEGLENAGPEVWIISHSFPVPDTYSAKASGQYRLQHPALKSNGRTTQYGVRSAELFQKALQ